MTEERLEKLTRNIEREGRYPPIIVRPHPNRRRYFQILDGHQRTEVLRRLGHDQALCFPWPCDDETALLLLATLNRLEGEDVPGKRAELLAELNRLMPMETLATLLPEDARAIDDALNLAKLDSEALLADLTRAATADGDGLRAIAFAVSRDDEATIEAAVGRVASSLTGPNRRGRALALICGGEHA